MGAVRTGKGGWILFPAFLSLWYYSPPISSPSFPVVLFSPEVIGEGDPEGVLLVLIELFGGI